MQAIAPKASMSLDERESYLIDLNNTASHLRHLRIWSIPYVLSMTLVLFSLFTTFSTGLLFEGIFNFCSQLREDASLTQLLQIFLISSGATSCMVVYMSYTPRNIALCSAVRPFWRDLNSLELSANGLTAVKAGSSKLIEWKKIKDIYLLDEAIYFLMGTKQINIALIPLSAFESQEQIDEALELIGTYWHGEIKTS